MDRAGAACGHQRGALYLAWLTDGPVRDVAHLSRGAGRSGSAIAMLREKGFSRLYDLQACERWVASEPKAR